MGKHLIFGLIAAGLGLLCGMAGRVVVTVLAYLSLIGGPGLYEPLLAAAERSDLFWLVTLGVAGVTLAVIYAVFGIIWLIRRARRVA